MDLTELIGGSALGDLELFTVRSILLFWYPLINLENVGRLFLQIIQVVKIVEVIHICILLWLFNIFLKFRCYFSQFKFCSINLSFQLISFLCLEANWIISSSCDDSSCSMTDSFIGTYTGNPVLPVSLVGVVL